MRTSRQLILLISLIVCCAGAARGQSTMSGCANTLGTPSAPSSMGGCGGGGGGGGHVYYVDEVAGSDSNNGLSAAGAWQTIGKVNAQAFSPGDTIRLQCANIWHEEFIVPSSGTLGNNITFTSYPGCMTNPEITAADVVGGGGWTQNSVTALDTQTFASGGLSGAYWSNTACTFPTSPVQGTSTHSLQCSAGSAASIQTSSLASTNTYEIDAYFQLQSSTATNGQKTRVFFAEASGWNNANGVAVWISFNGTNYQLSVGRGSATGSPLFNVTTGTWYLLRFLIKANGGASSDSATLFVNGTQQSALTGLSLTSPVNGDAKIGGGGAFNDTFTQNFDSLSVYNQDSTQLPNVWFTTLTTQPQTVIFNETQNFSTLAAQASASAVSSTNQWFWGSNVLYVYSVGNPASTYTSPGVQAANRTYTAIRNGQSYFTISNMILEGSNQHNAGGTGAGVFVGQTGPNDVGESSGVSFNNVEVRYHGWEGIWLDSVGGTMSNSYAHDNIGMCFDFDTGANMVATNIHGAYCQYGSYPGSIFAGIQNLRLIGCEFDHNSQNGLSLSIGSGYTVTGCYTHDNTFNGIYFDGTVVTGATITGNLSTGNGDTGIYISGGATETNITLSYNVVYSNTNKDIYVAGGAPSVRVYGNVLANSPIGLWITGANTAVDVKNNASYNHSTSEVELDTSASGAITINYNDWYHAAGGTFMNYHGTLYSFANWQSTASQDANSQSTNPLFTNAASNVYTLTGSSPLIGAGFNLGSTYSSALASSSAWPNGVVFATQGAGWNQGAYVYP